MNTKQALLAYAVLVAIWALCVSVAKADLQGDAETAAVRALLLDYDIRVEAEGAGQDPHWIPGFTEAHDMVQDGAESLDLGQWQAAIDQFNAAYEALSALPPIP